jgi:nucleotide-binding universal stress UspA family protein
MADACLHLVLPSRSGCYLDTHDRTHQREEARFGTILLAVDGSAHADRATELARKLATAGGDEVVVVHVTEMMVGRFTGPVDVDEDQEAITRTKQHTQELETAGVKPESSCTTPLAGTSRRSWSRLPGSTTRV